MGECPMLYLTCQKHTKNVFYKLKLIRKEIVEKLNVMMRKIKKYLSLLAVFALTLSVFSLVPVQAAEPFIFTLNAEVTDAGQNIYEVVIDYQTFRPSKVDVTDFEVIASGSSAAYGDVADSYGDFTDVARTIVKAEVSGTKIILTLLEGETGAGTLAYLKAGRNVPLDLTYTLNQLVDLDGTGADGTPVVIGKDLPYAWDGKVNDLETSKFVSVDDEINYQFYAPSGEPKGKSLIVWYHGNGEGDINGSGNNVAQLLGNRGTVAWATDEAQEAFDGAYVMAFQSPDTWYNAQSYGYLEITYAEIQKVVEKYGIDASRIYVAGCSAGGYMTTRMILEYPDLFAAANINCPALDVASDRGGLTPTDEELLKLKDAKTKIWLVQSDDDTVVKTADCARRIYNLIGEGEEVITKTSDMVTYQKDNIIYTELLTVDDQGTSKLAFMEDYNKDGVTETVLYSNHWSWIASLLNTPYNASEERLWDWMSKQAIVTPTTTTPDVPEKSPETADYSQIIVYSTLLGLSVVGFFILKKRSEIL